MAKKMSSGTSPGTATVRQPVRGSRIALSPSSVGNAGMRQPQQVDAVEEGRHHSRSEQLDLSREQQVPHRMVFGGEGFPALRDDKVLPPPARLVFGNRHLKHLVFLPFGQQKTRRAEALAGRRLVG